VLPVAVEPSTPGLADFAVLGEMRRLEVWNSASKAQLTLPAHRQLAPREWPLTHAINWRSRPNRKFALSNKFASERSFEDVDVRT